jgi:urease accessory protein UreE
MLIVRKGNRHVAAMVLNSSVNFVRGIVQCQVPGCEAHVVMMEKDGTPTAFIDDFMMTHDCDPNRFPERRRASSHRTHGTRRRH